VEFPFPNKLRGTGYIHEACIAVQVLKNCLNSFARNIINHSAFAVNILQ